MPRRNKNGEQRDLPNPLPEWLQEELDRERRQQERERSDSNKRRDPQRFWMGKPLVRKG